MAYKKHAIAIALIVLCATLAAVSADTILYETRTQTATQQVKDVATITTSTTSFTLPALYEGESATYTKDTSTAIYADAANLGSAVSVAVSKDVALKISSSELANFNAYYSSFVLTVKYAVAVGTHEIGDVAATLTIASPTATISLDNAVEGTPDTHTFNYEIAATAKTGISASNPSLTLALQVQSV